LCLQQGELPSRTYGVSLDNYETTSLDFHATTPILRITVPEMFNISVRAKDATINFRKKIMGDVSIDVQSGQVIIDQLRGEHISLQCNNGDILHNNWFIY
jgi:DUF4097 and DUF4098 domain-containing protein YvlB